jgi:transcriptional regulator with XRE-family HTH domain
VNRKNRKKPGPKVGTKHKDVKRSLFGARLFTARKARNFTQQELADLLRVTKRTIAYYESNTEGPTISMLHQIAKTLNVTASYLIGESKQKSIKFDIPDHLKKPVEQLKELPPKDQKTVIRTIEALTAEKLLSEK